MKSSRRGARLLWTGAVLALFPIMLLGLGAPVASAASKSTRTPADPAYSVTITGSADGRSWTGTESIGFRNASTVALTKVWLRLWSNGVVGCGAQAIQVSNVFGRVGGRPQPRLHGVAGDP